LFITSLFLLVSRCGGAEATTTTMFASNGEWVLEDVFYNWDLGVLVIPAFHAPFSNNAVSFIMSIPYSNSSLYTVIAGSMTARGGYHDSTTGIDALFNAPAAITIVFGVIGTTLNPMLSSTGNDTPYGYLVADTLNYCVRFVNATGTHGTSSVLGLCGNYGYRDGLGSNARFSNLNSVRVDGFDGVGGDCGFRQLLRAGDVLQLFVR